MHRSFSVWETLCRLSFALPCQYSNHSSTHTNTHITRSSTSYYPFSKHIFQSLSFCRGSRIMYKRSPSKALHVLIHHNIYILSRNNMGYYAKFKSFATSHNQPGNHRLEFGLLAVSTFTVGRYGSAECLYIFPASFARVKRWYFLKALFTRQIRFGEFF